MPGQSLWRFNVLRLTRILLWTGARQRHTRRVFLHFWRQWVRVLRLNRRQGRRRGRALARAILQKWSAWCLVPWYVPWYLQGAWYGWHRLSARALLRRSFAAWVGALDVGRAIPEVGRAMED